MKRIARSMLGVTLLEIMLVLAVAAMIIVMSVRYYQSASSNQQANAILMQIQAITAAADQLAQATGSYTGGGVSVAAITPLVPSGSMTTPWGTSISMPAIGTNTYQVTIGQMPAAVCPLIFSRLKANNHFTINAPTACSGTAAADFTYTYTANP